MRTSGRAPESIAWESVASAEYVVRHHYRYTYTAPVTDLAQRLMMVPPGRHGDQRLQTHQLEVRGTQRTPVIAWTRDEFGNRVCRLRIDRVEHAVDFEAQYRVTRSAEPNAEPQHRSRWSRRQLFLLPTPLTAPDARLRAAARDIQCAANSPAIRADLAHDWAAAAIDYHVGATGVHTPAAMALHLGKGVCQDYAHILLCLLRLLDIPARYVSGHLLGHGAPHAWVEALVGEHQLAFDPTHHCRAGLGYITVAVGRDFADITPTSGTFSGAAIGRLSASKAADVVTLSIVGPSESAVPRSTV
jgi:transglutaminase-like putative cysteine protease